MLCLVLENGQISTGQVFDPSCYRFLKYEWIACDWEFLLGDISWASVWCSRDYVCILGKMNLCVWNARVSECYIECSIILFLCWWQYVPNTLMAIPVSKCTAVKTSYKVVEGRSALGPIGSQRSGDNNTSLWLAVRGQVIIILASDWPNLFKTAAWVTY